MQTLNGVPIYPYEHDGTTVYVRDNTDRTVLQQVQREYLWDELPQWVYRVIDVGGHIGCFAAEVKLRYRDAVVISVEPDTANFALLQHNMRLYDLGGYRLGYVWYTPGAWALAKHNVHSSGHAIVPHTFSSPDYTTVALECRRYTLEELDSGVAPIDLFKLDCEGAEMDILTNVSSAWLARVRCVVGERHYTVEHFAPIVSRLEDEGFTVKDVSSATNPARGVFLAKRVGA